MKERLSRLFAAIRKRDEEKNDLLQSYFTSLMSLVLCVTMFLGTSYAWFTSEVTNVGNEIYIGVLNVELEKKSGDEWKSLSDTEGQGVNITKLYDGGIRWEPGYTSLETIRVVNEGELAFKYVLQFTDGNLSNGKEQEQQPIEDINALTLEDVAEFFDVWVFDHQKQSMDTVPTSFTAINVDTNWVNAGSLADVLAGTPVLTGEMTPDEIKAQIKQQNPAEQAEEQTPSDKEAGTHVYTIALHLNQKATADIMGHKISLNVKLVAYQMAAENDDFGTGTYDGGIMAVSTLEGVNGNLSQGGNVLMTVNMGIENTESRVTMNGGVLDGNGNKITYSVTKDENEPSLGVVTTTGGIVRNLTIEGGTAGRALYVTNLTSNLEVYNCTLSGVYSFNLTSKNRTTFEMMFVRTTFESWTSYDNVMEKASFVECTFKNVLKPYGDTILTDCVFTEGSKLDLSALEADEEVNLVNCTIGDVSGINATLKAGDAFAYVKNANYKLLVDGNGIVTLIENNG